MIYNFGDSYFFGNQYTYTDLQRDMSPIEGVGRNAAQWGDIQNFAQGIEQTAHLEGKDDIYYGEDSVENGDVEEFLEPGFRYLDDAMKLYWSDIRIPTKDSYRFMRAKIAGQSKSLQIWREDLKHARVRLPVMSISRSSHEFQPEKFLPPYGAIRTEFINRAGTKARQFFQPVPYNINYTLSIWAEHKRHAEHALNQILTRYNPLAEFIANDKHTYGVVTMHMKSAEDVSEKEATAEQKAKIKYEIGIKAEAWLSLPTRIMPTILGNVTFDEIDDIIEENTAQRRLVRVTPTTEI